jgi:type II secretory pathway pseudopilin PulG
MKVRTGGKSRVSRSPGGLSRAWRGGFTLIELLTIIVILGMLITLTTPSILEAKKIFATQESYTRMHLLEGAIRAYSVDWGVIPPSAAGSYPKALKGRRGLVQALTGYLGKDDDGKDGWGARKVERGAVYGPYVGTDQPMGGDPPAFIDALAKASTIIPAAFSAGIPFPLIRFWKRVGIELSARFNAGRMKGRAGK